MCRGYDVCGVVACVFCGVCDVCRYICVSIWCWGLCGDSRQANKGRNWVVGQEMRDRRWACSVSSRDSWGGGPCLPLWCS